MTKTEPNPFAPIEFVVTLVLALLGFFLVFTVVVDVTQVALGQRLSTSFAGLGSTRACIDTTTHGVPTYFDDGPRRAPNGIEGVRGTAATSSATAWEVCVRNPSRLVQALTAVPSVVGVVVLAGVLLLVRWTIRGARTHGMFTPETARRTRWVGWALLVGVLAGGATSAGARFLALRTVVAPYGWSWLPGQYDVSLVLVVVALGVLSFARILRLAVPLQEEVDATV